MKRTQLGLAAVVLTVFSVTAQPAAALQCKNFKISKSGDKKWTNLGARASARWKWHRHVKSQHGLVWSTWVRAKNKSYNCRRVRAKWRCTGIARPCRPF